MTVHNRSRLILAVFAVLVAAAALLTFQVNYAQADDIRDTKDFRRDVTLSGVR